MNRISSISRSLFVGVAIALRAAVATPASAQQTTPPASHSHSTELAITYSAEESKIVGAHCACFWLKGGSVAATVPIYKGLSVTANLTGEHSANIYQGAGGDLDELIILAGPRYTHRLDTHHVDLFAEWLGGGVHAFDSVFPALAAATTSANSFAIEAGGGVELGLGRGFSLPVEAYYVRTMLPNGFSGTQNNLRLSFGIAYRLRHLTR
jgi:hypothetical protein